MNDTANLYKKVDIFGTDNNIEHIPVITQRKTEY